ncbi:GDP-L-fucose synthase [Gammaproteobacteria bacterium]|nr:GDP-L-fucose synthase [Gammaproteobacteria bacterium]
MLDSKEECIFIAGHNGMVGSALIKKLNDEGYLNIITASRSELDLLKQKDVKKFFKEHPIDTVVIAAAKVGGIYSNSTYPADFMYQNLMIQSNIINTCHEEDINNILFLGSSCIYPKEAIQPINEDQLLQGPLESTNQWYAIAKIAGIKLCEAYNIQFNRDYRSIMPTNLYGPNDNFHELNGHVIPALISRFHRAVLEKSTFIEIWGTGKAKREFLHVDDLADGCVHLMKIDKLNYQKKIPTSNSHINIGTGIDIEIKMLIELLTEISGFNGEIRFDSTKPDGTMRKVLDVSLAKSLNWNSKISFHDGLKNSYQWYLDHFPNVKRS